MSDNLKLQSPWVTLAEEIKQLFKDDPDITIEYTDDNPYEIKLFVDNDEKAYALMQILPTEKIMGNVVFKITVVPANAENATSKTAKLFETAFEGNPAFSFVAETEPGMLTIPATYVVFTNKVVQFYNDDLSDYYRNKSTLYQNIAEDIFDRSLGVYFCTDIPKEESDEETDEDWSEDEDTDIGE